MNTTGRRRAREIDRHFGARLRVMRKTAGISQTALGEAIGVSFQQIQKYEIAQNRISASAMVMLADALGVTPADFHAGLTAQGRSALNRDQTAMIMSARGAAMAAVFNRLGAPQAEAIILMARAMAGAPERKAS